MKFNCLIVDDEPLARELLGSYISMVPQLTLAAACENALSAYHYLKKHPVDLIFLDMEMPLLKGYDFLAGLSDPPAVIITTAHREYAIEGYEMNIVDYLLKPIVFERFFKAVERFSAQHALISSNKDDSQRTDDCIFVQNGNKHIKVLLDHILFIESSKDYITIHLENGTDICIKHNISAFQKLLDDRFIRVHRSYIVNKSKITSFTKLEVWIGDNVIPVGDSYKDNWKTFSDHLLIRSAQRPIG